MGGGRVLPVFQVVDEAAQRNHRVADTIPAEENPFSDSLTCADANN
jgi:hypothetical protein